MKFSVGYNEKYGFLDLLKEKKNNISSVYFALPKELGTSGRPIRQYNGDYKSEIKELISTCKKYNIDTILLLNSTIESKDDFSVEKIKLLFDYIEEIIGYGLTSISITNMLYMKIILKRFPNLKYFSSVNCRLKTIEQAIFFKKLGINVLTIDRDINRNIDLIKKIESKT
ncbi:MAG: U32 family peptidase, partial [Candidatus Gracilibacteria bacterium]|nr:U32 family peptidase [Candidatus Gracilibacteria bacterium]